MFRAIFLSAGIAGLLAALALTLVQAVWITPLILQAETYEHGEPTQITATAHDHHDHANVAQTHGHDDDSHAEGHDHGDGWAPADGAERTFFTLVSNVVMGFAYALMLAGLYTLWRQPTGIAQGLLFGLAGFVVFFAAPGLGLPPELPGTEAADLGQRQMWWIGTAATTAVGLALLFMQKSAAFRVFGLAILAIPHFVGAPYPAVAGSLAPAELQNHFRLATAIGNAVFWLLLGVISAIAIRRLAEPRAAD